MQASPADGEVRVEVRARRRRPGPAGHESWTATRWRFACRTTARAFPPEIRDRMFDPFFTTKANGAGLGLAVVHRAIEAHRGLVFVDSGTRGTRFTVILPSAKPVAMRQPGLPQPAQRVAPRNWPPAAREFSRDRSRIQAERARRRRRNGHSRLAEHPAAQRRLRAAPRARRARGPRAHRRDVARHRAHRHSHAERRPASRFSPRRGRAIPTCR